MKMTYSISSIFDGPFNNDGLIRILIGDEARNLLEGGAGDDILLGRGGRDVFFDGAGDDVVLGGRGRDVFEAGAGFDVYNGGAGRDLVSFAAETQSVTVDLDRGRALSEAGQKVLISIENVLGGDGDDTIIGDDRANVLNGGEGVDILTGGAGRDAFVLSETPFGDVDVSGAERSIVGGEDSITDFEFNRDTYRLNTDVFGVDGDVAFAAVDANAKGAADAVDGANIIVLLNNDTDGDPDTPFLAGTAANQIAELVDDDGAGFFVYYNSNLDLNRLVYSTNLNSSDADLQILSRQTDLLGQDAVQALNDFSAANFTFVTDDFALA